MAPLSLEDMNFVLQAMNAQGLGTRLELDTAPALIEYTTYTPSVGSVSILRHAVNYNSVLCQLFCTSCKFCIHYMYV